MGHYKESVIILVLLFKTAELQLVYCGCIVVFRGGEVMLNILRCQLTYYGQVVTNAEARFSKSLHPWKPEGSLGRTAQDGHLDSHTTPEL